MLKFLIDTQLPPRLATWIRNNSIEAKHTFDYPKGQFLSDSEIRKIAVNEDFIIVTKDTDFFEYFLIKGIPPKVLLLEVGNISNGDLIDLFEKYFPKIIEMFNNENASVVIQNYNRTISY